LLRIVEKIPAIPEFTVADAVNSKLDLLADDRGNLPGQTVGRRRHGRQLAAWDVLIAVSLRFMSALLPGPR